MASTKLKGIKRKKDEFDLVAENIDNCAPVDKILDELQFKNNQAFVFYCNNLRQRYTTKSSSLRNFHFVTPGHPLSKFEENWDGTLAEEYFESFPYKSIVKYITKIKYNDNKDPLTSYMKKKSDWNQNLRNLRHIALKRHLVSEYEVLNEEVWQCPKNFVDIAACIDSDPDPFFDSLYNWYYTGNGNIQLISINWIDYLLHSEFNTICISNFSKDDIKINQDPLASFNCGDKINIVETICSDQNIVAIRTMYKIVILKIDLQNDNITFDRLKEFESNFPFTSINFDKYHKNILYVTTLDNQLKIVNIDRMMCRTVKLKGKLNTLVNNWSTIIGSERTYYTHVNKNSFHVYDKRTNNVVHTWKGTQVNSDEVNCNDITVAKQNECSNFIYYGTDHHLFLLDIRCLNSTPKPLQRWTHGMESPPTYLSICNFEFNKELICLSSQWCEDMCVVSNYSDEIKHQIHGVMIPYRPKSVLNVLADARENLKCDELGNVIDSRLCTAISGNTVYEQGEKYVVLMQNSLGDISAHTLFPEHLELFIDDDSVISLEEWSRDCTINRKNFEVTNVIDISKIWMNLKMVPGDHNLTDSIKYRYRNNFNENEIFNSFENEIDSGLKEAWFKDADETLADPNESTILKLRYSDSDSDK